ncbi:ABC transporter [Candidatus Parcubacteria bacterium]|nr:MAG: ABC transporter [Candidatus Parcubacteria bacterium]
MMHFLVPIATIWQREILRYTRDRIRIATTLIQPLMFLAVFGVGLRQTLAQGNFGIDFVQFMYPGIIAMSVMGVAFFSAISTVWDREFGFLREILVAPVARTSIALGKALGATTVAALQAFILLLLAPILGIRIDPFSLLELFSLLLFLAFAISGIGLLVASLMKTTESFGLLMQVLVFPMFFLSGAFFPLTKVPLWMLAIARLNPLTYGVDALRQIILRPQVAPETLRTVVLYPVAVNALFLIAFSAVMVSAAVAVFTKKS